jgi:hypothetical protein
MKKIIFLFLVTLTLSTNAQNIQILVGMPSSSEKFINWATVEFYKPLDLGPLYYFTDFKISKEGYFESYTEISKYWNVGKILALTAQYNAGLNKDFQIQPVYLAGISKSFIIGKTFNLSIDFLYRYQRELLLYDEIHNGYQITAIFSQDFNKIQIFGYCDFWNTHYYMFEPQSWYKFSKRIYAGLEWRISNYDLLDDYQNYLMLGLKFNLE